MEHTLTLPYANTLPYLTIYLIELNSYTTWPIYFEFLCYFPFDTTDNSEPTPSLTIPYRNTIPYLALYLIKTYPTLPYTLFNLTLKLLDRFTSNFQVTFSLTQLTIWNPPRHSQYLTLIPYPTLLLPLTFAPKFYLANFFVFN